MSTDGRGRRIARSTARHARRATVFVGGWLVVTAGLAMLVLPGPGLLVIVAGLGLLAVEFTWARRWRDAALVRAKQAADKARTAGRRRPPAQDGPGTDDPRPPRRPGSVARIPVPLTTEDRAA